MESDDSYACSVTIPATPVAFTVNLTLSDSTHYKLDDTINNGSLVYTGGPKEFYVSVIPKEASSSYNNRVTYHITVNRTTSNNGGGGNSGSSGTVESNPKTGVASVFVVFVILGLSIYGSIVIYNKRVIAEDISNKN